MYTQADKIASVARFATQSQYTLGRPVGSVADVEDFGDRHVLFVDQHEWEHLPARAKSFDAKFLIQKGWFSANGPGRAFGHVQAADGSVCVVVLR